MVERSRQRLAVPKGKRWREFDFASVEQCRKPCRPDNRHQMASGTHCRPGTESNERGHLARIVPSHKPGVKRLELR